MSFSFILQTLLPTLLPVLAGWATARYLKLSPDVVRDLLRWVFFPVLLLLIVIDTQPYPIAVYKRLVRLSL